MPVRDVATWVTEAIWSVLQQSLQDLELIVVDDGSRDETPSLVREIQQRDPRVRFLRNDGAGGARARNLAIARARGDYLAFADGDDIVPRDAYRRLWEQAAASGSDMVVGGHLVWKSDLGLVSRASSLPVFSVLREGIRLGAAPELLRDRVCWNRIIRRQAWFDIGNRFEESPRSNDIAAMTRSYCAFSFDVIPDPVYIYRRRPGATSMSSARHSPESMRAHLEQESLCADEIAKLGDSATTRSYFAGVLMHDIWEQIIPMFREGTSADPMHHQMRELLISFVKRAPVESLDELSEEQRLVFALLRSEEVPFAEAVLNRASPDRLRSYIAVAELPRFVARAHELTHTVNGMLTDLFHSFAKEQLAFAVPDDRAVFALQEAQRAGIPLGRLSDEERALIGIPPLVPPDAGGRESPALPEASRKSRVLFFPRRIYARALRELTVLRNRGD